jgi:hypothetical protein
MLRIMLGACEVCGKSAELGAGDRTCESCGLGFEKLCHACADAPCRVCGAGLVRTDEIFPHSLFKAIRNGSVTAVEHVLGDHPATSLDDLRERHTNRHPLAAAALLDDRAQALAICRLLLERGATPHARTGQVGRTSLILMARYRVFHKKVADLLAASINDVDDQGYTALMFAAVGQGLFGQRRGNLGMVKYLVGLGADVSVRTNLGSTALDHAIRRNDTEQNGDVIDYLRSVQPLEAPRNAPIGKGDQEAEASEPADAQEAPPGPPCNPLGASAAARRDEFDLACAVRSVFADGEPRPRDRAIRDLAVSLGFRRVGANIRGRMDNALRTAVRRGILENSTEGLSISNASIRAYHKDDLQKQFLASLRGRGWTGRDEAILNFARWLGFARTGGVITQKAESTVRDLIRQGRLERGRRSIRRRS